MESTTFPRVLSSLIDSINTEGCLRSWQINSTLECYSLTVEWTRLSSRQEERDFRNSQVFCQSACQESPPNIIKQENLTETSAALSADSRKGELHDLEDNILEKNSKSADCSDFQTRCLQSPKMDESIEEFDDHGKCEIAKATMMENKIRYGTRECDRGIRKPVASQKKTRVYRQKFNRENLNLSPENASEHHKATEADFQTTCLQSPKMDESFEEFDDHGECEITKATMMENKIRYGTRECVRGKRKPVASQKKTRVYRQKFNRENFNLSPENASEHHKATEADELTNDNVIAEITGVCFSKQKQDHRKKATCSCGETFNSRHLSVNHLLFHCPVSLCFRIQLECNIQREIDSWHGDEKVAGEAWWQGFKKNGFPDVLLELQDEKVDRLSALVSHFIGRASTQTLKDQNGKDFLLMAGLKELYL